MKLVSACLILGGGIAAASAQQAQSQKGNPAVLAATAEALVLERQVGDDAAMYWSSPKLGWIISRSGILRATQDGGQSWQQRGIAPVNEVQRVRFDASGERGVVIGREGYELAETSDGGRSWRRQELPDLVGDKEADDAWNGSYIDYSADMRQAIVSVSCKYKAWRSPDGGKSWLPVTLQIEGKKVCFSRTRYGDDGAVYAFGKIDIGPPKTDRLFDLGESASYALRSRDGGASWETLCKLSKEQVTPADMQKACGFQESFNKRLADEFLSGDKHEPLAEIGQQIRAGRFDEATWRRSRAEAPDAFASDGTGGRYFVTPNLVAVERNGKLQRFYGGLPGVITSASVDEATGTVHAVADCKGFRLAPGASEWTLLSNPPDCLLDLAWSTRGKRLLMLSSKGVYELDAAAGPRRLLKAPEEYGYGESTRLNLSSDGMQAWLSRGDDYLGASEGSRDGGLHWADLKLPKGAERMHCDTSCFVLDGEQRLFAGPPWKSLHRFKEELEIEQLRFSDAKQAWAIVGEEENGLMRGSDGGKNWKGEVIRKGKLLKLLTSAQMPDNTWALGELPGALLLRHGAGGWEPVRLPEAQGDEVQHWTSCRSADGRNGLVISNHGSYLTQDGGLSWRGAPGVPQALGQCVISSRQLWVIGEYSVQQFRLPPAPGP